MNYRLKTMPVVFIATGCLYGALNALQKHGDTLSASDASRADGVPNTNHKNDENTTQAPAYFLPVL
jgi:hypothetical protein